MRVTAIAIPALLAAACSSDGAQGTPPTLEVTSPARGTMAMGDSVQVTGRVTDDGKVRVAINGVEAPVGADGTFTATVPVTAGVALIETHAIDSGGNDVRDVRAVLAGALAPTDGSVASPLGARAGVTALKSIGNAMATAAEAIDYTTAAQAFNPIYNNTGCLGARIDITSVTIGSIDASIVPTTGALDTAVALNNVTVRLHASYKAACIGGSTNITLQSSKARIRGDINLGVTAGKLDAQLPNATVVLEGFSLDVGGVPGAVEDLFRSQVRGKVESALTTIIRTKVPPIAEQKLAGLRAKGVSTSVLGKATSFTVTPKKVDISTGGLYIGVDTKLVVTGGEGGTALSNPIPLDPAFMDATRGLGVALADDTLNQLFAGLWAADAFDKHLPIESVGALGAILDDDAATLDVQMMLPPTVTTDSKTLTLSIGDMMVVVKDSAGSELQRIAISLRTTLKAGPTQSGKILLTLGAPEIHANIVAQSDAVQRPLTDDQVEGLVSAAWGLLETAADDALGKLPLPTIAGIPLGAPAIEGKNGYVVADVAVD